MWRAVEHDAVEWGQRQLERCEEMVQKGRKSESV